MLRRLRPPITASNGRWWTLGAMCLALVMAQLDVTVVNVALPSIQRGLHASTAALEWTINAYTLSYAVLLVTGGRLGDLFGRRRTFLVGVVVFALSSAAIGFSPNEGWLVGWRAVQGAGAALMMPATLAIITDAFPAHERGKAIGTWAGASALALAIGPVVGGFLAQSVSWQSIFFINLPVAAGAVLVTFIVTRESRDHTAARHIDVAGITLLTFGLGAFVLALIESSSWHWGSARELSLLGGAAVSLVAFVVVELRIDNPMVDFGFFRSRSFLGANLVGFTITFSLLAMFFFLALYMQNVMHYTPLQTGVRFLPATIAIVFAAPAAGRLADRFGPRPLIVMGLALVATALWWQSLLTVSTSYGTLVGGFIMMGVGMALVISPTSTAAMNSVPTAKSGVGSGILSMSRQVGGTFGVAVLGALVSSLGHGKINELLPTVPASIRGRLADRLGGAAGSLHLAPSLVDAANQAFVYGLQQSLRVGAVVALLGAVIAAGTIGSKSAVGAPRPEVEPERAKSVIGLTFVRGE